MCQCKGALNMNLATREAGQRKGQGRESFKVMEISKYEIAHRSKQGPKRPLPKQTSGRRAKESQASQLACGRSQM